FFLRTAPCRGGLYIRPAAFWPLARHGSIRRSTPTRRTAPVGAAIGRPQPPLGAQGEVARSAGGDQNLRSPPADNPSVMASPCQLPFTGEPLKEESTVFHRVTQGTLSYSVADSLAGASHGFTTRLGGVSTGHLASLNLGHHRGDDPANVYENYRILGH